VPADSTRFPTVTAGAVTLRALTMVIVYGRSNPPTASVKTMSPPVPAFKVNVQLLAAESAFTVPPKTMSAPVGTLP